MSRPLSEAREKDRHAPGPSLSIAVSALAVTASLTTLLAMDPPSKGRKVTDIYKEMCASCHGPDMAGGSGGSLAHPAWRFGSDDVSVARSIRDGHPEAGMPAFGQKLNAAEIRGLVVYMHEKRAAWDTEHTKFNKPEIGERVESKSAVFTLQPVLTSGVAEPWAVAFLPDGSMLITERAGRLRVVRNGQLEAEPVRGTPAVYGGEGGLLDVAPGPNYSQPGQDWIYLSYGDKSADGSGMSAVIRGRIRDGAFVDQQQIFKADAALYRPGGQRFGSRLAFDDHGHLFFSIGDRAYPGDEQSLAHPNGKIHRVNLDGSIPADNPFVGKAGALPSIWSYGHRNPQGLAFHPVTRELWETEHGPRGGDELNLIQRGRNYGWPLITFGINYDGTPITDHTAQEGMEQPITYWLPSIAASPIAFYAGTRFPAWKNNLLVGSLAAQELRRLVISGHTVTHQEILFKGIGRVRDIVNAPDGSILIVLNEPDRIVRLVPAST